MLTKTEVEVMATEEWERFVTQQTEEVLKRHGRGLHLLPALRPAVQDDWKERSIGPKESPETRLKAMITIILLRSLEAVRDSLNYTIYP